MDSETLHQAATKLSFRSEEDKPSVTGVTYKMVRPDPGIPKLKIKTGRFFEDIPISEFAQADLITDLYGVISYTPRLDEVLRRYHQILKPTGRAYLFLGNFVISPIYEKGPDGLEIGEAVGKYSPPFANSSVLKKNGSTVSLLDWIHELPGFHSRIEFVEVLPRRRLDGPTGKTQRSTLVLEKRDQRTTIPRLKLIQSDEEKPPSRDFEELPQ